MEVFFKKVLCLEHLNRDDVETSQVEECTYS